MRLYALVSRMEAEFRLAKDFIRALLNPDPSKRPTVEEALKHTVWYSALLYSTVLIFPVTIPVVNITLAFD